MQNGFYLNEETRMIEISFGVENIPTKQWALVYCTFEFTATGAVSPTLRIETGRLTRMTSTNEFSKGISMFLPQGPCASGPCQSKLVKDMWTRHARTLNASYYYIFNGNHSQPQQQQQPASFQDEVEAWDQLFDTRWRALFGLPMFPENFDIFLAFVSLSLYFLVSELEEIVAAGFTYFHSVWNVFDLIIVVLMIATMSIYVLAQWYSPMPFVSLDIWDGKIDKNFIYHLGAPNPREAYVDYLKQSRVSMAALLLLSYIKVRTCTQMQESSIKCDGVHRAPGGHA